MKKRVLYLDVLKCIAIICVCSYHFPWVSDMEYSQTLAVGTVWRRFVFGFNCICVPLFFMVNGSLVFSKEYENKKWIQNMFYLIIQLLLWRCISILIIGLFQNVDLTGNGMRYLANAVFFGAFEGINLSHMWFIYALIIVYLLFPFIKNGLKQSLNRNNYICFFMGIMFVLCFFTKSWITIVKVFPFLGGIELENIRSFLGFDGMYGPMLFYFILGGILYQQRTKLEKLSGWIFVAMFVVAGAMLYIKWYFESTAIGYTYDNVFWGYDCVSGLVLSTSVYVLIMKSEHKFVRLPQKLKGAISFLGNNTIGVYYIHWILGTIILPFLYEKVMQWDGLVLNFGKAVILVIVCSTIAEISKKIPVIRYLFSGKVQNNMPIKTKNKK